MAGASFINLGFEDGVAGQPGTPTGWTAGVVQETASLYAGYDGSLERQGSEDFEEGWDGNEDADFDLDAANTAGPSYNPSDVEDFENAWLGNEAFKFTIDPAVAAGYDTTPQSFEDYEEEWGTPGNEGFLFAFVGPPTDLDAADYDTTPQAFEDFEEEWKGNENFKTVFVGVPTDLDAATFFAGGTPRDVEDFEDVDTSRFVVEVVAAVSGDYIVQVNTSIFKFTRGSENTTQIRDSLVTLIQAGSEPVTASNGTGDTLKLTPDLTGEEFTASVDGPTPGDITIQDTDRTAFWTASGLLP